MSSGTLQVHAVDKHGLPYSGVDIVAHKGSTTKTCSTSAGACYLVLPYGTWTLIARSNNKCWMSTPINKAIHGSVASVTIQLNVALDCEEDETVCPPCAPCPPCTSISAAESKATSYGSSTKKNQGSRTRIGGINMSDCRWIPTTTTPSGALNADGTINWAAFSSGSDAVTLVGQENLDRVFEAVLLDVINKGEDPADAQVIALAAKVHILLDNVNGKYYALADATATSSYAGFFVQKCGVALNLPWMLLGAGVLGGIGMAIGSRFGKGGKRKGAGFSAKNAAIGGLAGVAAGAGFGFLAAKLATPSYMKAAGLGRISRSAYRRRRVA
jgi:hypothetical protein